MKFSTSWPFVRTAIDEEIEHHMLERTEKLLERTEKLVEQGCRPKQARREAERRFGDVRRVRRSMLRIHQRADRGERFVEFMLSLWRDVRHGVRLARSAPGFAITLVLTIGVGVGANTALFSVTDAVLLRPLPYEAPDELVSITSYYPTEDGMLRWMPAARALDLQRAELRLAGLILFARLSFVETGVEDPASLSAHVVSSQWADVLGVTPRIGRSFNEEDADSSSPLVVALSDATWRTRFAADPGVVGTIIQLDHRDYTIVGVMGPGFKFPPNGSSDVWVPLRTDGTVDGVRSVPNLRVLGRIAAHDTIGIVQERLEAVAAGLSEASPESEGWQLGVEEFDRFRAQDDVERALWVLTAVAAVMLAIATINAANLLLVRATARQGELAVRLALGASRARLVRQTVSEALVLVGAGGLVAVFLARAVLATLVGLLPRQVTFFLTNEIVIETRVLAFALLATAAVGAAMSIVPALRATGDARDAGGRAGTTGRATIWLRQVLVVGQVAMTLALLAVAGLMISSFLRLMAVDPGYDPVGLLQVGIDLPAERYQDDRARRGFFDTLTDRIAAQSAVSHVALADGVPPHSGFMFNVSLQAEGEALRTFPDELLPVAWVDAAFFATLGTPIVAGRSFTAEDAEQPGNVIIDRAMARFLWGVENPIGRRFRFDANDGPWLTVVGLVGDLKLLGQDDRNHTMELFYPLQRDEAYEYMTLLIRSTAEPAALVAAIRRAVRALDADLPIALIETGTRALAGANDKPRFFLLLMSLFAALSLILAVIGIYATVAFGVRQRRRELGIRGALGARGPQLQALILRQGLRLVATGVALGLVGALALGAAARSLLFNTEPTDPLTLASVAVVMLLSAVVACWIPARRATRVDPVEALRAD